MPAADSSRRIEALAASHLHPFLRHLLDEPHSDLPRPTDAEDWSRIISDAADQGLTLILYRWLSTAGASYDPPAESLAELKARAIGLVAQNLVLTRELTAVLQTFRHYQLPCIPIRGPALAEQLYGDVTARVMGDLDLLVPRDRLVDVERILTGIGYREIDRRPGFARTYSYTLEFVKERPEPISLEPHWTIAYPPFADRVDMGAVWQRAVPGTVGGVDTLLLSRTDLLLHLCFHLLHKGEQAPLLWWYELALVIRQEPDALDWTQVLHIARQSGQGELLAGLLSKFHALFGSPIPAPIFAQLKAPSESASRNFLHRRLTSLLRGDSGVDGRESLAHLLTMKGFQAKWRYACGILFPSSEFMRAHYGLSGRPWLGFRYMARLLYFLWEGGKGLVGLVAIRPTPRQSPPR